MEEFFLTLALNRYEWTHVSVTYDGNILSFYINGELDHYEPATISVSSSLTIIGQYLLDHPDIGAREPWNGYLDNIEFGILLFHSKKFNNL